MLEVWKSIHSWRKGYKPYKRPTVKNLVVIDIQGENFGKVNCAIQKLYDRCMRYCSNMSENEATDCVVG